MNNKIQSYEISQDFNKAYQAKICQVPQALKSECTKNIIKAHTISKSANLKHIARDGKVYTMYIDYLNIQEDGKVELKLQGINQASTFYIFCSKHDKEIFSPIEDKPFVFSNHQIFLLSYRIIAKAIYLKRQQIKLFKDKVINYGIGLDKSKQEYFYNISSDLSNYDLQLKTLETIKSIYDNNFLNKNFKDIKYYSIVINKVPEIMVAGAFFPDIDFNGEIKEDALNDNAMFISIIKVNSNGVIIFSWNNQIESLYCEQFIKSFSMIPDDEKIKALTCFLFKKAKESLCISPDWHENLEDHKKELIEYSYNNPFDDFINDYDKFDFFDWNIVDIKTNIAI